MTFATKFAALALAGAAILVPREADAQSVLFDFYTNGCFGVGCTPVQDINFQSAPLAPGLIFENARFTSYTDPDGFLPVGSAANARGVQDVDSYGAFYLDSSLSSTYSGEFNLLITFLQPSSLTQLFTAAISGSVTTTPGGGVHVQFDPSGGAYRSFSSGGYNYEVYVDNVSVMSTGGTSCPQGNGYECVPVTGFVSATQVVPEPMSMALLGTGLAGLGAVRRRRRQSLV